jgi:hypothetical protein
MIVARVQPSFLPPAIDSAPLAPAKPSAPTRSEIKPELLGSITEGAYLPRSEAEHREEHALIARAVVIGHPERFTRDAGIMRPSAAADLFDELLHDARPAFSRTGGAVGLLSIDEGPSILTLARHSKDFAIRHELHHIAREAHSVTNRGVSLFEKEKTASWFTRFGLMLKEESIVWCKTLR